MILSIDCGTQSTRAILFSFDGEEVDKVQIFYEPYFSSKPGWAEQKAEVYWDSLCKATTTLKKKSPDNFKKIKGVGISTIRNTMVNVDESGKVLRPAILWLDHRTAEDVYRPNFVLKLIFKAIGKTEILKKWNAKGHVTGLDKMNLIFGKKPINIYRSPDF